MILYVLQCSGIGTADTCLTGADKDDAKPKCTSDTSMVGVCGKCQKVDGTTGDGDGTTKGSCTGADDNCAASGKCVCQVVNTGVTPNTAADGDGTAQGTCSDVTKMCKADGTCKCAKVTGTAGDGDGSTEGTCGAGKCCCSGGECKTYAELGTGVTSCTGQSC